MAEKQRLDLKLVELGFCETREKAKALIMSGIVFVNNQKCDKAGDTESSDSGSQDANQDAQVDNAEDE